MIGRREFITGLGAAATVGSHTTRAQDAARPVIGFLNGFSPEAWADPIAAFHAGLKEAGFEIGRNCAIEYRWAEADYRRLPALAAELVTKGIAVLVATGGSVAALAAKAATRDIPIVFGSGGDPVRLGLVESYGRPGGNATGVYFLTTELEGKRLGLLRELAPGSHLIGVLANPKLGAADAQIADLGRAAQTVGQPVHVENATTAAEIDAAFVQFSRRQVKALLVAADPFFLTRRQQIIALVAQQALPAIYEQREFVTAGGLASYGTSLSDASRQVGEYTGRILKGAKPADLPVLRSIRLALMLNLKTAAALGLDLPASLLLSADEVIE